MSGVPAVEIETPAAPAPEADLLDDAPAAEPAKTDDAATPDKVESKPADDKKAGDDGAKADDADLLADDGEGKSDTKADGKTDVDKGGAPETYEAFTLPDGFQMDDALLAKATPVLKSIGVKGASQEDAQKLVSFFAEVQAESAKQQQDGFERVKKDWRAELTADRDYGGDNLSKTRSDAKAFLQKFGTPRLLNDLKEWGWSNHPDLLKAFAAAQRAHFSEDTLVVADAAAQSKAPKSIAERLWGDQSTNKS